jgi:hypothetical protein
MQALALAGKLSPGGVSQDQQPAFWCILVEPKLVGLDDGPRKQRRE